eukprot:11222723-Lingulodinium_polyedra.AAC.1
MSWGAPFVQPRFSGGRVPAGLLYFPAGYPENATSGAGAIPVHCWHWPGWRCLVRFVLAPRRGGFQ